MKEIVLNEDVYGIINGDIASIYYLHHCYEVNKKQLKKFVNKLIDFDDSVPIAKDGEINWNKIKIGTPFTAVLDSELIVGKIQKQTPEHGAEKLIYFCQDTHCGAVCREKLGYKYSWTISDGTFAELGRHDVQFISFKKDVTPPKHFLRKRKFEHKFEVEISLDYKMEIRTGFVAIGCQAIPNDKIREVLKLMESIKE